MKSAAYSRINKDFNRAAQPVFSTGYFVARIAHLEGGSQVFDVPVSRKVFSFGTARRMLKRALRRDADVYVVASRATHRAFNSLNGSHRG